MPANLWEALARGDEAARDELLQSNLSLVYHVARQLSRRMSAKASTDELVSFGTIGLIGALEAFDAERGLAFSTFAVPRIRGAILDELRRQDHVPRSMRRKMRQLSQARERFQSANGRAPSDMELAEELGVDVPTMWQWAADVEGAVQLSLDQPATDGGDERAEARFDMLPSPDERSVEDELTLEQEKVYLEEAIRGLGKQERIVLSLSFYEGLKLKEIGVILDLTESRVSQVRTRALSRLREKLAGLRGPVISRLVA